MRKFPDLYISYLFVQRMEERITFYPADVVLFEGILVFYPQKVRDMFHMKLFVDTDSDVRLSRRGIPVPLSRAVFQFFHFLCFWLVSFTLVLRDMSRGRDLEQILTQYTTFVKPAFEEFCLPVGKKIDLALMPVNKHLWNIAFLYLVMS